MNKGLIFTTVLIFIIMTALAVVISNNQKKNYKRDFIIETDKAVVKARSLYKKSVADGINMQSGPCLTNDLLPGWVVDIVHNPRNEIDELPENQCPAFREGRAIHFVELDQAGNLIRVR